jgi:colanic acid/amylovoran biosynthesis glycosyltransferase
MNWRKLILLRNLVIYRDDLLAPSEGFVLAQGEALQRFQPFYVGLRKTGLVNTPENRTLLLASGGMFRRRLQWFGPNQKAIEKVRLLNPALIHAQFGPDGVHAMPFANQLNVPLVVTFHGYDATMSDEALAAMCFDTRLYTRRRKQLQETGSLFLCVSQFIREKLLVKGFPLAKTRVHYIGVDTAFFKPDRTMERNNLVLFVGRLVENKGCDFLLQAMAEVQESTPKAEVVIIGDGPLRAALETKARGLQIANCRFLGVQPQEVIRQWMNRARVFCVPSVEIASGASEGFGLVFAEAQSMGLPVVSFRTGGISEAVADGQTGLLATPRDAQMLARQIDLLLSSRETWERFSAEARARVTRLFDLKKQSVILEQIYQALLVGADRPATRAAHA